MGVGEGMFGFRAGEGEGGGAGEEGEGKGKEGKEGEGKWEEGEGKGEEREEGKGEERVVYDQEDAVEFAERWVRMDTRGLLGEGMEWGGVVAGEETTFVVAREVVEETKGEAGG